MQLDADTACLSIITMVDDSLPSSDRVRPNSQMKPPVPEESIFWMPSRQIVRVAFLGQPLSSNLGLDQVLSHRCGLVCTDSELEGAQAVSRGSTRARDGRDEGQLSHLRLDDIIALLVERMKSEATTAPSLTTPLIELV